MKGHSDRAAGMELQQIDLGLDQADLDTCVQCGLCLPHCPTYRVSGDETMSPRGRISLMRAVQLDGAPVNEHVLESFDTCVQCRGCEPACPSGVPYGKLISDTKAALSRKPRSRLARWGLRLMLAPLSRPRLLRALFAAAALGARLGLRGRLATGRRGLRLLPHRASGDDVWLFTGCAMDAWQRDVHHSTQRVLEAAGAGVTPTGDLAPCCGSLHHHAGLAERARELAQRTIDALSDDERPVIVNSAGCGAAMKEYGELLGTEQAREFSKRVFDVHEWLAGRVGMLVRAAATADGPAGSGTSDSGPAAAEAAEQPALRPPLIPLITAEGTAGADAAKPTASSGVPQDTTSLEGAKSTRGPTGKGVAGGRATQDIVPLDLRVAVQDPCHLRHVQRTHAAVRTVLAPFVREIAELDDDGLCCGAGGAYSVFQPELAGRIADRKLAVIAQAAPDVVASANPGCSIHLASRGLPVEHPMTLIARALDIAD